MIARRWLYFKRRAVTSIDSTIGLSEALSGELQELTHAIEELNA